MRHQSIIMLNKLYHSLITFTGLEISIFNHKILFKYKEANIQTVEFGIHVYKKDILASTSTDKVLVTGVVFGVIKHIDRF